MQKIILCFVVLHCISDFALAAGQPPIIVRSPPLEVSSMTLERLQKLGAFRSGPILFKVGCKVVQGRIVKVSTEQSSGYPFLDREGIDWVTKHWSFGTAATGTYHVPLVVGAGTKSRTGQALPPEAHPTHFVPKLSNATWNALVQSRHGVAFRARLTVKIEVRDGSILSARVIRSSSVAMADSAVIQWIKSRWRFQKTVQGRHIFEFFIDADPSPKRRRIEVRSKGKG
ncbi:MAG: hypothetical protein WB586_16380 [Chthoniobacterales bacterium]